MNRGRVLAAGIALTAVSAPAAAQIWIGQIVGQMMANGAAANARHNCMMGVPMVDAEVDEARGPAQATMDGYFAAAQSGSPRSAFFKLDKKTRWTAGGTSAGSQKIDAQPDPFAAAGRWLQLEEFVRSGQNATALGQWRVREADGKLAGTYTGYFVREQGDWKLRTLNLAGPREYAAPVEQYCNDPGDVMPYRLDYTQAVRAGAEKALAKAERNFTKYRQQADVAVAKAEEHRNNSQARSAAAEARGRAKDWERRLGEAKTALDTARTDEAKAIAEAKARADREASERAGLQGAG